MAIKLNTLPFDKANPDDLLIFLHIPKTAGTSFVTLMEKNYGDKSKRLYGSELRTLINNGQYANYKAFNGHFSITEKFYQEIFQPFNHITAFRDPIDRVISQYYYLRKNIHHPMHEEAMNISLIDIFKTNRAYAFGMDNHQVRVLSAATLYSNGQVARASAQHYIQSAFTFFGFTDKMDEFILLCEDKFKWQYTDLSELNVNETRPSRSELRASELQMIEDMHRQEIEFYSFVKGIYEERFRERIEYLKAKKVREAAEKKGRESEVIFVPHYLHKTVEPEVVEQIEQPEVKLSWWRRAWQAIKNYFDLNKTELPWEKGDK